MSALARTRPRSTGRCSLCRGPVRGRQKVTRVAGKGWAHSECAAAARKAGAR